MQGLRGRHFEKMRMFFLAQKIATSGQKCRFMPFYRRCFYYLFTE